MKNKGLVLKVALVLFCFLFECYFADAQIFKRKKGDIDDDPIVKELPTYATSLYARADLPPGSPLPDLIYTTEPAKYLAGNKCVDEYTVSKGFLFVSTDDLMQENDPDPISLWFMNWSEKTRIFFREGPFWKRKLKKRIEQCKLSSGFYK